MASRSIYMMTMRLEPCFGALFAQVQAEQGRLDILVNNAMTIPYSMTSSAPFWEKPLADEWDIWDIGLRTAFIASHHAAKIMAPKGSGLIACMSGYVGCTYTDDVIFGTTKTATDRMARDMGVELKPHGVARSRCGRASLIPSGRLRI